MERDGLGGFEIVVLGLGGAAAAVLGVVAGGGALALLAAGRDPAITAEAVGAAARRLPANLSDPAAAWPAPYAEQLPGPLLYWVCTAVAGAAIAALVVGFVKVFGRAKVGTSKRRPLGVDARPRFARARDLAPLLVRAPPAGRVVGARFGRRLLAPEAPPTPGGPRGPPPPPVNGGDLVAGIGARLRSSGRHGRGRPPPRSGGSSNGTGLRSCRR